MRDHLLQLASREPLERRRNVAREYLQAYVLRLLQEAGVLDAWSFVGGTALRLLHDLPRFSEDLDFTALPDHAGDASRVATAAQALGHDLVAAGYRITLKTRAVRAVGQVAVRFEGLPADLAITRDSRLALLIKLEVDLRPPAGATRIVTLMARFFPVAIRHDDLPSLFAGKVHALLCRPWNKGRDVYDLFWYLTAQRGLEPNAPLLAAALEQTGADPALGPSWRQAVVERLERADWAALGREVRPFLERPADWDQLTLEQIGKLLGRAATERRRR
jgi:hypothetical protein